MLAPVKPGRKVLVSGVPIRTGPMRIVGLRDLPVCINCRYLVADPVPGQSGVYRARAWLQKQSRTRFFVNPKGVRDVLVIDFNPHADKRFDDPRVTRLDNPEKK